MDNNQYTDILYSMTFYKNIVYCIPKPTSGGNVVGGSGLALELGRDRSGLAVDLAGSNVAGGSGADRGTISSSSPLTSTSSDRHISDAAKYI